MKQKHRSKKLILLIGLKVNFVRFFSNLVVCCFVNVVLNVDERDKKLSRNAKCIAAKTLGVLGSILLTRFDALQNAERVVQVTFLSYDL
jgi:hypothetical protein